jgi:predicted CopG family antitoxin
MSTSIRIQDETYSRLENNSKGYESVSETISRAVFSLEVCESLEMISSSIESSIRMLIDEDISREKVILLHYQKEAIEKAMLLAKRLYPNYVITYEIEINSLTFLIEKESD